MRFRVSKNGDCVLITDSFKHAAEAYNKTIYGAKSGDFVRMEYRKKPNDQWELVKKDWL